MIGKIEVLSIDRSPGGKKIFEEAENFMIKKWQEAL
jgi:hypothetical protein